MTMHTTRTNAVRVDPQPDTPPALDLIDDIEGVRIRFFTSKITHPTRCSTDSFRFPIDTAYELPPLVLWTHQLNSVIVRDMEGDVRAQTTYHENATLPPGEYTIDICSLGIKTYLRVQGEILIVSDEERGRTIDCSAAESVQIGLRSFHDSPATTVTTTDQPHDVMRTLSCLGSALKTTACERSFPTLRGHPPRIERGGQFDAPATLERTEETASVRIEVPPTLEAIYPIAPLAYYLNAVVRPGETPRLVGAGWTHSLDHNDGVEQGVAQLLKHVFTLDCITRTEGLYPITLGERTTLEDRLADTGIEIDFATLYDLSLAEQVQRYLSIPFDLIADLVPRWPLTVDVRPVPMHLPYLPFVVASLGTIRCLPMSYSWSPPEDPPEIEAFYRTAGNKTPHNDGTLRGAAAPLMRSGAATRSAEDPTDYALSSDIHCPPDSDSIAQLWLAEGYPMRGTKPTLAAYQHRFDAIPADTHEVAVISNNTAMEAESDVAELYGQHEQMPFEVTIYENLSCADLRNVFASKHDLIHYVGHVDAEGLQCTDGWLDANTLDTVDARLFILNGCRSYEQGKALVDKGAISGLCTVANVGNTPATRIGRTVAKLLDRGFSLSGILDIIGGESLTGQQYMIVGDPSTAVLQKYVNTSTLAEITHTADDEFTVDIHGYPTIQSQIGMLHAPAIGDNTYFLNSGHMTTVTATRTEVAEYLHHDRFPVRLDGSITWSDTLSVDAIE